MADDEAGADRASAFFTDLPRDDQRKSIVKMLMRDRIRAIRKGNLAVASQAAVRIADLLVLEDQQRSKHEIAAALPPPDFTVVAMPSGSFIGPMPEHLQAIRDGLQVFDGPEDDPEDEPAALRRPGDLRPAERAYSARLAEALGDSAEWCRLRGLQLIETLDMGAVDAMEQAQGEYRAIARRH